MNIALDFDTLWYGVRSEYILAGGAEFTKIPDSWGWFMSIRKGWRF